MIIKLQENTIFIDDNAVNTFNFLIKRKTKKKQKNKKEKTKIFHRERKSNVWIKTRYPTPLLSQNLSFKHFI